MKIRSTLVFTIAGLMIFYLAINFWMNQKMTSKIVQALARRQLSVFAESYRDHITDLMRSGADHYLLVNILNKLKRNHSEIKELKIIQKKTGIPSDAKGRIYDFSQRAMKQNSALIMPAEKGKEKLLYFFYPIHLEKNCLNCHQGKEGQRKGVLSMALDIGFIDQIATSNRHLQQIIQVIQIGFLLFLLYMALNKLIFSPLERLRNGADKMSRGDYTHKVPGESNDELGVVIKSFNYMAAMIHDMASKKEQIISDRTDKLALLLKTSNTLSSTFLLSDVLEQFAEIIIQSSQMSYSRILLLNGKLNSIYVKASCFQNHPVFFKKEFYFMKDQCPSVWEVINKKKRKYFYDKSSLNAKEQNLLFPVESKMALCLPIIHKEEALGIVVIGQVESSAKGSIKKQKISFIQAMVDQLGIAIKNSSLHSDLISRTKETVFAMAQAVDKKSQWTAGHSRRVAYYSVIIARKMKISREQIHTLRIAAVLHDIGKIATPTRILDKPTQLTREEYEIITRHPLDGVEIIRRLSQFNSVLPAIKHHHEWYNGEGYPDKLTGENIPLYARIISVADAFDAMTADRPYRLGLSNIKACERLQEGAGRQFDPMVVNIVVDIILKQTQQINIGIQVG